jgi:1-deoxy-D-xylulose-5-phosphate synthase
MCLLAPKDFEELEGSLRFASQYNGPIAIRYPRGTEKKIHIESQNLKQIQYGVNNKIIEGKDITILSCGKFTSTAIEVAQKLKEKNISVEVIHALFIKPIDEESIIKSVIKTKKLITIEDGYISGGFGSKVLEMLNNRDVKDIKVEMVGYPNKFIEHGDLSDIEKKYQLDLEGIERKCIELIRQSK